MFGSNSTKSMNTKISQLKRPLTPNCDIERDSRSRKVDNMYLIREITWNRG